MSPDVMPAATAVILIRRASRVVANHHADGEGSNERYAYILAPQQMNPGDSIRSGSDAGIKTGNSLPLSAIPVGTALHNVEMHPGKGGQLARSAGTAARLVTKGLLLHYNSTAAVYEVELSTIWIAYDCWLLVVPLHTPLSGCLL